MASQINALRISEPIFYHREYKNDLHLTAHEQGADATWIDTSQRIAFAALPFFSLYKPLSLPLSLAMGGLRTYTSITQLIETTKTGDAQAISLATLQAVVAVIALAGTIFAHPLGMLISTGNDIAIEIAKLISNLKQGEYEKALANCLCIINNATYLTLCIHGGMELAAISFATQVLVGLYHSQAEFRQGHYIEATGHLLMSMVRGAQFREQIRGIQARNEFRKNAAVCLNQTHNAVAGSSQHVETYNVAVVKEGGLTFHIATYNNGVQVLTCLDGPMSGSQGVFVDGVIIAETSIMQLYGDHFVHYYIDGKVYTYANKQVIEF